MIPSNSLEKPFYLQKRFVLLLWVLVTMIFVIDSWITNRLNNYLIFENTIRNLLERKSLYAFYPHFHEDANHYGPAFSLIIAPFALLPNYLGLLCWNLFNCMVLFGAIQTLPVSKDHRQAIGLIAIPCLIESMLNQQFNPIAGALIILNYTQLNRSKGFIASFFMMLGIFVKLYGIIGLAFFFFIKDKPRYIIYSVFWAIIFFLVPMIFSSPAYILNAYQEWFSSLSEKNALNVLGAGIDMSIMGFFRSLLQLPHLSNTLFLFTGAILFAIPYLNHRRLRNTDFQLLILSSALIFPVIFSTGAEDCTFIIAVLGVGIWYIKEENKMLKNILLPVLLLITCNFPLLFFPVYAKSRPLLLSIISFIYFVVWLRVLFNAFVIRLPDK
ncbi:glycosyltransferase family 87 protein [Pedobacter sp. SG908]|uniref:glycosyltransferase family 87 protein n=1 Tax=Pedobacter sp. SG908 TaxID=2587135 RepID=UPI00141EE350|nr:glycosyltransferase family 87 protein [Pedobacter sp. SG908]NII83217.1 hypothetical protein [Pedobacter sp. SG908]